MKCSKCGEKNNNKSVFCIKCGEKLTKRRTILIPAVFAALFVAALILGVLFFISKKTSSDCITRYEWSKIICEEFGLEENTDAPYFIDVDEDNEYFGFVQRLGRWQIVDGSKFEGEKAVDGKYAAATLMRAIGKYRIKIYLEMESDPDDEKLLDIAIDEGVILAEQKNKRLSEDEAGDAVTKALDLKRRANEKDDYCNVKYKENVIDLTDKFVGGDDLPEDNAIIKGQDLKAGDVILFNNEKGVMQSRKIEAVNLDGSYQLAAANPSDIIDELQVSEAMDITFEDILNGEDWDEIRHNDYQLTAADRDSYNAQLLKSDKGENTISDFTVTAAFVKDGINLTVHCEDLGLTGVKHISADTSALSLVDESNEGNVAKGETSFFMTINELKLNYQMDHDGMDLNYLNVDISEESTWGGNIALVKAWDKIPLLNPTIVFSSGVFSVKLGLYAKVNAKGEITVSWELPASFSATYEKGKGFSKNAGGLDFRNFKVAADVKGEMWVCFEVVPCIAGGSLIDIEGAGGTYLGASAQPRLGQNDVILCSDVELAAPLVKIMIGDDDDEPKVVMTLWKFISNDFGLLDEGNKIEFNIITGDNAPVKGNYHFEMKKDGSFSRVDKCTCEGFGFNLIGDSQDKQDGAADDLLNALKKYKDERYMLSYGGYEFRVLEAENGYMSESSWREEDDCYKVDGYIRTPVIVMKVGDKNSGDDGLGQLEGNEINVYDHKLKLGSAQSVGYKKNILDGYCGMEDNGERKAILVEAIDGKEYDPDGTNYFFYGPFTEPLIPQYYDAFYGERVAFEESDKYFWILCEAEEGYYEDGGECFDEKMDGAWYAASLTIPGISEKAQTIRISKDAVFAIPASSMEKEQIIAFSDVYSGNNTYNDVRDFYDFFAANEYGWNPVAFAKMSFNDEGYVNEIVPNVLND